VGDEQLIATGIMTRLRSLHRRCCVRQINWSAKLREILRAFSREKIPVIVLKGAALAELVYKGFGLRTMLDVDLLIKKTDLDAADEVLRRMGYVPDESYQSEKWYRENHHHLAPYIAPDRSFVLEVHHHIVPKGARINLTIDDFWQRARAAPVSSIPALFPSPQDLLMSICIHLSARRCFVRTLRDLTDIAAIISVYGAGLDWDQLVREANICGAASCLYYSLWLANSVLGAPLPPGLLTSLKSAARIGRTRDSCLKFLALRAVFLDLLNIPDWFIIDVVSEFLYSRFVPGAVSVLSKWLRRGNLTRREDVTWQRN
jgi:hypothetical protein